MKTNITFYGHPFIKADCKGLGFSHSRALKNSLFLNILFMVSTFEMLHGIKNPILAICEVDGGPEYEINLSGQAANMEFCFVDPDQERSMIAANQNKAESTQISQSEVKVNFGKIAFDCIAEKEILLRNTGNVGFEYNASDVLNSTENIEPGQISVFPSSGFVQENVKLRN